MSGEEIPGGGVDGGRCLKTRGRREQSLCCQDAGQELPCSWKPLTAVPERAEERGPACTRELVQEDLGGERRVGEADAGRGDGWPAPHGLYSLDFGKRDGLLLSRSQENAGFGGCGQVLRSLFQSLGKPGGLSPGRVTGSGNASLHWGQSALLCDFLVHVVL